MWRFFETEINRIVSEDLRMFVKFFLENYVPAYFWEIGASSSGKYHPKFSQGYGGLVRHTKAACLFLEDLLRMSSLSVPVISCVLSEGGSGGALGIGMGNSVAMCSSAWYGVISPEGAASILGRYSSPEQKKEQFTVERKGRQTFYANRPSCSHG